MRSQMLLPKCSTINFLFVCYLFFLLLSCTQKEKKIAATITEEQKSKIITEFENGNRHLDRGESEAAAKIYDSLIANQYGSSIDNLITYNSGIAHYEMKNCEVAHSRFRKVIRTSENNPNLKSRAMLFISDVYSCLGDDNKAIANLLELYRGRYPLSVEVAHAELPAKLAAAYARLGNNKEAKRYFNIAERGLIQVINSTSDKKNQSTHLARVLYLMGNTSQLNLINMSSEDYFTTLRALQKYLYKSIEFDDNNWSKKSFTQLLLAYSQGWHFIENMPLPQGQDEALAARQKNLLQLQVAQHAVLSAQSFYVEKIPFQDEPQIVKNIILQIKKEELKYKNFIASNIVGTSLTPEALKAQSIKRVGRVLNPNPILEIKAMQKIRKK